MIEVPGGWLRWNEAKGKCDAHCAAHHLCRLNRTLARGAIGLQMAWLEESLNDPSHDFASHALQKEIISGPGAFDRRFAAREEFQAVALSEKRWNPHRHILYLEKLARDGGEDEPLELPCRTIIGSMATLAAEDDDT